MLHATPTVLYCIFADIFPSMFVRIPISISSDPSTPSRAWFHFHPAFVRYVV